MDIPQELLYTPNHEWVRIDGSRATIGMTDYVQMEMGLVVFAELPEEGDELQAGDLLGTMESVTAETDVFMPLSGTVVSINRVLGKNPHYINRFPYGSGWLIQIEMNKPEELEALWSAEKYADVFEERL
ncbi:glycine cleavage system protein GcvH [Paenibacillus sp. 1P03SA]|uniref:glycine cleavage system protein GcvH n=1 Tax=Paenibacillus sp. 1P03SA TaxID=3132294 RepID=UPI0039A33AD5